MRNGISLKVCPSCHGEREYGDFCMSCYGTGTVVELECERVWTGRALLIYFGTICVVLIGLYGLLRWFRLL